MFSKFSVNPAKFLLAHKEAVRLCSNLSGTVAIAKLVAGTSMQIAPSVTGFWLADSTPKR